MGDFSPHYSEHEFRSRGRPLAPGTVGAYRNLSVGTLEPAHEIAERIAGQRIIGKVISGQRLPDHNTAVGGAPKSYHLPPEDAGRSGRFEVAADVRYKTMGGTTLSGATHARIAEAVRAGMKAGRIPKGGASSYHEEWNPGAPGKEPFVHLDNRGYLAAWE
jgi:hypothetical protein